MKVLIALFLLWTTACFAQEIMFRVPPVYPTPPSPQWLELADMDGDGDLDAVTVEYADVVSTITVSLNNGGGVYLSRTSYPIGEGAKNLAVGDFNGDQRPDVVASNYLSGTHVSTPNSYVTTYMNNGSGQLVNRRNHNVGQNAHPSELVIADFDVDGWLDFAVVALMEYAVYIYRSLGDGTFALHRTVSTQSPSYLATTDVNADGRPDLIVGNVDATFVYRNTPSAFVEAQYLNNWPDGVSGIATGDFDADGDADCITSGRMLVLHRNQGGSFTKAASFATRNNISGIEAKDMDADGDLDIVGALYLGNAYSVYYNDGAANFPLQRDWGVGDNPWNVAVGDVNLDGTVDVVAPSSQLSASNFNVALGYGNKRFVTRREYGVIGGAWGVGFGDFDNDGLADVATGVSVSNQDRMAVFYGKPDGELEDAFYMENFGNNMPTDVAVEDFNLDGKPDIAASIFSPGNRVRVFMNVGNRSFAQSISLAAGGNPLGLGTGLINNDAYPDIVVANGAQLDSCIHVYYGNGDGTFQAGIRYVTYLRPTDASFGDFDKDGDEDFFITHGSSVNALLFRSDGFGGLTPETIVIGTTQNGSVVEDFDGDTWLDIAMATGNVTLLRNSGDGGFGPPEANNVDAGHIAAADLEGDGDMDIVGTVQPISIAVVGRNNGDAVFTQIADLKTGYQPDRVGAGDIDGDRRPDIVVATDGSLSAIKNITARTVVLPPVSYQVGPGNVTSGTLASLTLSDDARLTMRPSAVLTSASPPVSLLVNATSPVPSAESITLTIETSGSTSGLQRRVSAYNFTTGKWVPLDVRIDTLSDQASTFVVLAGASSYIEPGTRKISVRVTWKATTPVLAFPWTANVDLLSWSVLPTE